MHTLHKFGRFIFECPIISVSPCSYMNLVICCPKKVISSLRKIINTMQLIPIASFHVLYAFSSIQISECQYQNIKIKIELYSLFVDYVCINNRQC